MFNQYSGLVAVWVRLIEKGEYSKDSIPPLSNLREIVFQILEEKGL